MSKELTVTEDAVRDAMDNCPQAKDVLQRLFGNQLSARQPQKGQVVLYEGRHQAPRLLVQKGSSLLGINLSEGTIGTSVERGDSLSASYKQVRNGRVVMFVTDGLVTRAEFWEE